jgi:transposase InsO family protein
MLRNIEKPIVHSDRGCHYRWPGWLERIEKAQLIRSMSKKDVRLTMQHVKVFLLDLRMRCFTVTPGLILR